MGNVQVQPTVQVTVPQCPSDFQSSGTQTCQIKCPSGFKTQQGGSGENNSCVNESNNAYSLLVYPIPLTASQEIFAGERTRFARAFQDLQNRIAEDESAERALQQETSKYNVVATDYEAVRSRYSTYNNIQAATEELKDTIDILKPRRGPTAPDLQSDMEVERRNIMDTVSQKLVMVQVALVTILLCVVQYIVLPNEYAHKVAFITASVGLGVGIFLTSKK